MPDKKETILLLENIADLLDFKGENKFKVGAYRFGAISIRRFEGDFEEAVKQKELDKIKGIGKSLQSIIYEYFEEGESSLYKQLKEEVPAGIEQLLVIKGLGARKINLLYDELGISNINELETACRENRLAMLKGFGAATQKKILTEIENQKHHSKFVLLDTAEEFASEIISKLQTIAEVKKIEISGELRRGMEIISSIHIVLLINNKINFLKELKHKFEFQVSDWIILIKDYISIPINLHLTLSEDEFVKTLFITTGSDSFLAYLKVDPGKIKGRTEAEIFKSLKSSFVIPEMREAEYFTVKNKSLFNNSDLTEENFKGLLHFHTVYSDGRNTLDEMIDAAIKRRFRYAAVCDHSKTAIYANGLSEERILKEMEEIEQISSFKKLYIFKGIESDILSDGSLDYSSDFMSNFQFVVASIHSQFSMDEDKMTQRILKAVENPFTDILGHPSGRLLLSRAPYKFNIKKIIDACVTNGVAIEINSNPRRLDLDWRWIYYAREKGCLFSINPDAHSIKEIDLIKYGVITGRKAGLRNSEVINCFSLAEFKNFLNRKVKRKFHKEIK
ncbi:MAG TPA: PHP domain-containing protein [Ignavibacteriaceae bacterium]|nr:PHP domain-containing protein [Ignavibacteriaceae bacterium]